MNEVHFVDTTLRDGTQSLWAESMTTGMMLPVAERMDQAGFEAMAKTGDDTLLFPDDMAHDWDEAEWAW